MAFAEDDDPSMHIDLPPRNPQFPQGARNWQQQPNASETPATPFSEGDSPTERGDYDFSQPKNNPYSMASRYQVLLDEGPTPPTSDQPPIPVALTLSTIDSTPLPKIPMIVLSIAVLGEFLSANVSTPFIVDMTRGFNLGDAAELGSYTGAIVASFFITQFLTSLLWATVADKHGNRTVLAIALTGNALTCALFGTCRSFPEAITVRLIQGIFNGAVGVARSTVVRVTMPDNEGRAYSIMGFSWGLGGVAGAIIGGAFQTPSKTWPNSFGRIPLFQTFPYLLPTSIAALILLTGAILSLFLAWDGGPREGAIRLSLEKPSDEEQAAVAPSIDLGAASPLGEERTPSFSDFTRGARRKVSGYFARRVREAHGQNTPDANSPNSPAPILVPVSSPKIRQYSRQANINNGGSAYGYRSRLGSQATFTTAMRRGSTASGVLRSRRSSQYPQETILNGGEPSTAPREDLSLAQRLVMANENTGTTLPSLWVAAAINADHEDVFAASDDEEGHMSSDDDVEVAESSRGQYRFLGNSRRPHSFSSSPNRNRLESALQSRGSHGPFGRLPQAYAPFGRYPSITAELGESLAPPGVESRRPSTSSYVLLPAIYTNTGVHTPPALLDARPSLAATVGNSDPFVDTLQPITEGEVTAPPPRAVVIQEPDLGQEKAPDSLKWTHLPLFIIFQYFILALHSTSHDQVFLMYLTVDYTKGGLGLDPGHFATLIALMCIAQVCYQFYLYPNIGPPRGKFSHLAMFRLGSALFIPGYVSVIFYRAFASTSEDGNAILMSLLAVSTAIRYAGSTFAYTSIAVLINYLSPPAYVAFANGLAQSLASLARVIGPLLGGQLWALSTLHGPEGYPFGFYAVALLCAASVLLSFFIR